MAGGTYPLGPYDPSAVNATPIDLLLGAISVTAYRTSGAGTSADPYLGWDTATPWAANKLFIFEADKTYAFSSTITAWAKSGIRISGGGMGTVLKFTGAGIAIDATALAPDMHGGHVWGCVYENFKIVGNATCTKLFVANHNSHIAMRNVYARECTTRAYEFVSCVLGNIDARFSVNEEVNTTIPVTAFYVEANALTFTNFIAEGAQVGLELGGQASWNTFMGGSPEGNSVRGCIIGADANQNYFYSLDFESNTTEDVKCSGYRNSFMHCNSAGTFKIATGANGNENKIIGGVYNAITVEAGCLRNAFSLLSYASSGGAFTDGGTDTLIGDNVLSAVTGKPRSRTLYGRIKFMSTTVPTISATTGLDTGSAAFVSGSGEAQMLVTLSPTGAPAAQGTVTIDFATSYSGAVPMAFLIYGSASWDRRAVAQGEVVTATQFRIYWDNNGVALAAGSTYRIQIRVSGRLAAE